MRVSKPLQLSLLTRTYHWQNKNLMAVSLLLGFPFDSSAETMLEQDLWKFLAEQLSDGLLDVGMPKLQGEVLVFGSYHAPGGNPVTADQVQLDLGPVTKTLSVIGDRYWRSILAPTAPEPFTQMPISYEYAFGGESHKFNPVGKGIDPVDYFGEPRIPMPNVEDPNGLITSKDARPQPAGFGPLDMMWEYRSAKMGTYDESWQQDHFPGYPLDIDWSHFNVAPPDQWIDEFWRGGESFRVVNMHPDKCEISGKLPAFRARCFVEQHVDHSTLFSEVDMRAETVCLFPSEETGVLVYRGVIEVAEDDASDIEHLLVAYEDLLQQPRSKEYYAESLRNRLDDRQIFKYMMYSKDIIPDSERCGYARMLESVDMGAVSAFGANLNAKAAAEKQKALELLEQQKLELKHKLEAAKIDPAPYLEKLELKEGLPDDPHLQTIMQTLEEILPGSTSGDAKKVKVEAVDFSKFIELGKQMDAMGEAKKELAREQLQETIKQVEGTKAEEQVREQIETAIRKMDAPPELPRPLGEDEWNELRNQLKRIEEIREQMRAKGIEEDKLPQLNADLDGIENKLLQDFEKMKELYRQGAHYVEGTPPHKEPLDIIQYRMQKLIDKGESLAGHDFAGVDFSGQDLAGRDLSDCFLEYANFSGCNLRGADLRRAVITHANLAGADLVETDLRESNLGGSNLEGADLSRAHLIGSEFSKANLKGARVVDCDLDGIMFLETGMEGVDMSLSRLNGINFVDLDFNDARFVGAQVKECNFLKGSVQRVDFSEADLTGSTFVECNLDRARFYKAEMENVRFLTGCSLNNCSFEKANLEKVNMRDADARGSSFEFSCFNQADFGGANLTNTSFYAAEGKRAMLIKADLEGADFSSVNLMEGSLMKARLNNADLRDSNFYAVEFMNAVVGGTDFRGANLDLTKLEDWRPDRDS